MGLIARIVIVGRCLENESVEQVARQDRKKKRTADGRQEGSGDARGGREGFFLALLKSPFPPPFLKASYGTRGNCEST